MNHSRRCTSKPVQPTLLSKLTALVGRLVRETSGAAGAAPRTPVSDSANVLDLEKLQTLDDVLPGEETNAFVELYLTDADSQLAAIADAAKRADWNVIARSAHVLVSTAGNVGAAAVSLGARRLMEACRANDAAAIDAAVGELQAASRAASQALRAWLAARSAGMRTAGRV
jgi:HPt (histidine-containing phosphotransfer) domain-containing protein